MWKRMWMLCAVMIVSIFPLTVPDALFAACGVDPPLPPDGFSWPATGPVSGTWSLDCQTDRGHRGIDIDLPTGSTIRASAGGVVIFAGFTPAEGGGTTVSIEHPGGIRTTYVHIANVTVAQGDPVTQGQVLGSSDGAPLHFGMKISSPREMYFNPELFLDSPSLPAGYQENLVEPFVPSPTSPSPEITSGQPATQAAPAVPITVNDPALQPETSALQAAATDVATAFAPLMAQTADASMNAIRIQSLRLPHAGTFFLTDPGQLHQETIMDSAASLESNGLTARPGVRYTGTPEISGKNIPAEKRSSLTVKERPSMRNLFLAALLLMITAAGGAIGKIAGSEPTTRGFKATMAVSKPAAT